MIGKSCEMQYNGNSIKLVILTDNKFHSSHALNVEFLLHRKQKMISVC